ncbi:MAG: Omp28-related outer membrane protein [Alistipes sp.]|nr:Omp28-related outer membrane protein [Alistipes sp.]
MKFTKFFALVAATVAMFAACTPGGDATTATGDITLSAETVVEVNTPIHFVVKDSSGANVTNGATIFDKSHDFAQVENPFTPTVDGDYTFYAVVGDAISKDFKVTVTPEVPALPEDTDAANTSFKHRILLVDHTGNTCGYCPHMMKALKEIEESGDFDGKYYEAMSHSYSNTDPAFSGAAASISSHYGLQGYPTLTYNFYHPTSSSYNAEHIKGQINALWKESADAGIAASTNLAAKSVVVNAEVKAAVDGEYSITAWLLEDGIYAKQTNATDEWMNTHNNAIRQAATTSPLTGYELGTLKTGETAEQILNLTIARDTWNRDNMKVMLIVSKKGDNKKFDVANVVICPINDSVTYDYK